MDPIIDTFGDFYSQQPHQEILSNINGNGLEKVDELATKIFADGLAADKPITIFGDGSVKDRRGAHATRLYLGSEYLDTYYSIQSAAITSGADPATITSLHEALSFF